MEIWRNVLVIENEHGLFVINGEFEMLIKFRKRIDKLTFISFIYFLWDHSKTLYFELESFNSKFSEFFVSPLNKLIAHA